MKSTAHFLFGVVPLLLGVGCLADPVSKEPAPTDTDEPVVDPADLDEDGDGYGAADDCDDTDPTVFPAGTEVCGGGDEDCDGTVDEGDAVGALLWYADTDRDGFGDPEAGTPACEAPVWSVSDATDCDDTDSATSPAGTEVCGGGDEDCDGTVDEDDAADAPTWYADADGDTFGDEGAPVFACESPPGAVADATDCDDLDPTVSPDGTEHCGGVDEDCDGAVDEASAADASSWYADADGDGYGDAGTLTVACVAPPGSVADAADCDDTDALVSPAGSEVCGGGDEDCDGEVDEDGGEGPLLWYADTDGDGFGDASVATLACRAPPGQVADATDCDDADDTVSPASPELCGGADENCDGVVDEDPSDAPSWYADTDGDGYGDAAFREVACVGPADTVTDATDCDDGDGTIHPGASDLGCDRVDDDCDGAADGRVVFTDTTGSETDVSAAFAAGTASAPTTYTISSAGSLAVCDGTWYARLVVDADPVSIVGAGSALTTLSAGGAGSVVTSLSSASVSLEGFTATGASTSAVYAGAAVDLDLTLDDVALTANDGTNGGGLHQELGTLSMDATSVTSNTAEYGWGGGLYLLDVATTITNSDISDNGAFNSPAYYAVKGGGVYISPGALTMSDTTLDGNWTSSAVGWGAAVYATAPIHLDRCEVTNNRVSANGYPGGFGALSVADGEIKNSWITDNTYFDDVVTAGIHQTGGTLVLDCSEDGGVLRNVGTASIVGGARVFGTLVSIGCDWGTGADDNYYTDIEFNWGSDVYWYGSAASFTCDAASETCY